MQELAARLAEYATPTQATQPADATPQGHGPKTVGVDGMHFIDERFRPWITNVSAGKAGETCPLESGWRLVIAGPVLPVPSTADYGQQGRCRASTSSPTSTTPS